MTEQQPTQKQIKEFWEWCGFKYEDYNSPAFPHQGGCWIDPDGKPVIIEENEHGFSRLPDLDPNNLLKYALPRLNDSQRARLLGQFKHDGSFTFDWFWDNPTLTLFWAIWGVIHG